MSDPTKAVIRRPLPQEMDSLYAMGYDVWGQGDDLPTHLHDCRTSPKYQAGEWYVLVDDQQPLSSLIVYRHGYHLPSGCVGIGSVATAADQRRQGYASKLVSVVSELLLAESECHAIFLHSDIGAEFYRQLGYQPVMEDSACMVRKTSPDVYLERIPDYF